MFYKFNSTKNHQEKYPPTIFLLNSPSKSQAEFRTWFLQVRWQRLFVNATMEFLQEKGLIESESLVDSKRTGNQRKLALQLMRPGSSLIRMNAHGLVEGTWRNFSFGPKIVEDSRFYHGLSSFIHVFHDDSICSHEVSTTEKAMKCAATRTAGLAVYLGRCLRWCASKLTTRNWTIIHLE